jgi:uroporphyrinogen-III decarboxylase
VSEAVVYAELRQLIDMIDVDAPCLETGRRRQGAVWRGEAPDRVPILLGRSESRQVADRVGPQFFRLCEHQLRGGPAVPEYHEFDHYTLREQFHDPRKMLVESLWDMVGWARARSDAQLSFRPNFGVPTVASVFGCGAEMGENDMPWVTDRPSREALLEVEVDGIERRGLVPRVVEFIELAQEALAALPEVHVFMPDTQGPMNLAFLLREQGIMIDMLEDAAYFHRLLERICDVFIALSRYFKGLLKEPLDGGVHGSLYMAGGGVRIVDDVSIMLSPEQYREFVLPYVRRCLAPFGGGWVHSCGDISHQLGFYLETEEIKGVNFGEPEYYDFAELLPRFAASGTFCYGGPVRRDDESADAYLARTAACVSGSPHALIFQPRMQGQDMREGEWPATEAILARWAELCGGG